LGYQRVKALLGFATLAAGLVVATAAPASAAPASGEGVPVVDASGQPINGAEVLDSGTVGAQAITPVLGSTFDAYIGDVKVHFMNAYQWLDRGNSWTFGRSRLTMQTDGNLVVYNKNTGEAKWWSGTHGKPITQMLFQPDDNLVLYTSGYASAPWATGSNRCFSYEVPLLATQSDSNFVIYCGEVSASGSLYVRPIWATNTVM
jgi:hypothetical protein